MDYDLDEAEAARMDRELTEEEKNILKPYFYLTSVCGKGIRYTFLHAINYWLKVPDDKLREIAAIVTHCHQATLLADDIQDNAILRRGLPVAHKIYGVPKTLNAVNYMSGVILQRMLGLENREATRMYCDEWIDCLRGQGMELYWRDNFVCPTEEEYRKMATQKTGASIVTGVKLLQLHSPEGHDLVPFTKAISLYYQINDDYLNLTSPAYHAKKGFCDDVCEGKYSFPAIHAIRGGSAEGAIVQDILTERTDDAERKKYFISLLEKCGSFEYTKKVLRELTLTIVKEMTKFEANPLMIRFITQLHGMK